MTGQDDYVRAILGDAARRPAREESADAFMPSNIALIKYWGKRPGPLNLPLVSSLSYTLDGYGSKTRVALAKSDSIKMNGKELDIKDEAYVKAFEFLDLFRAPGEHYRVETENNIPTAAGVASSASGFAALLSALVRLKKWRLPLRQRSMLARLGSGSAARSFWPGLVLWHKGVRVDGMDCYAEPWSGRKGLHMAVLLLDSAKKKWSSREAMKISLFTSPLASEWPMLQQRHLESALAAKSFASLGETVENNAILLHTLLEQATPSIVFDRDATREWKGRVHSWRKDGLPVYFTQDAGPNLKLLFPLEFKEKVSEKLAHEGIDYFIV